MIWFPNTDYTIVTVLIFACSSSHLARWELTFHGNITWR